eukprot:scaffold15305_cov126-Cylindrotheca_fusiformis.AAC.8
MSAVQEEEEDDRSNVTDPRDTDVLCGRGGAALRHPGNQTYRRLVNLNKGLYITCLKTEKLKISRSIVAAIREQNGRFLERDAKKGVWNDIGDKKAIEKTSQALREGQPKLKQKMVEMGQMPQDGNVNVDQRYGNGIYNPRGNPVPGVVNGMRVNMPPPPSRGSSNDPMNPEGLISRLSLSSSIPSWTPSMGSNDSHSLRLSSIPPNSVPSWTPSLNSMSTASIKLSSIPPNSIPSWTPSVNSMDTGSMRSRMQGRGQFGGNSVDVSSAGLMSQYSTASGGGEMNYNGMDVEMDMPVHAPNHPGNQPIPPPPPPVQPAMSPMMASPGMTRASPFDRRRLFAKMKYNRPSSSSRSREPMDGMPDVQMVESNLSLMSNFSSHGGSKQDGIPSFSDHSNGLGSRRSLMSGLSKISDTSGVNSVFSDLSKKISNSSSRSIAMSEFSDIQEAFNEDFDGFNFDAVTEPKPSA